MGCHKLHTEREPPLRLIHRIKGQKPSKITGSCYPFGLRHRGYNDVVSANVNSVASRFKYNGIEYEESLGVDWYEMDMRQYDPAIARWTSIDPVTHFSQSTYNGYDNNPVIFADPSGADVIETSYGTTYTGADAQSMFRSLQTQYGGSSGCDDCKEGETKNKYETYGLFPFENMTITQLTDREAEDWFEKFQLLTFYGWDPQDLHESRLKAIYDVLSNLDEKSQIKILKAIGMSAKNASKFIKGLGILGLDPFAIHDGFMESIPGIGVLLGSISKQLASEDRSIANELKWNAIFSGFDQLINQSDIDLTNVVLIYTSENLFNKTNITLDELKSLDYNYPNGDYDYLYYGTQSGSEIVIFGRHENRYNPGSHIDD